MDGRFCAIQQFCQITVLLAIENWQRRSFFWLTHWKFWAHRFYNERAPKRSEEGSETRAFFIRQWYSNWVSRYVSGSGAKIFTVRDPIVRSGWAPVFPGRWHNDFKAVGVAHWWHYFL
jgi:hypothetical protein